MTRAAVAWLVVVAAAGRAAPAPAADGDATGTLVYRGTTLALTRVYLIRR